MRTDVSQLSHNCILTVSVAAQITVRVRVPLKGEEGRHGPLRGFIPSTALLASRAGHRRTTHPAVGIVAIIHPQELGRVPLVIQRPSCLRE